ncbi:MAG TPA: hypothetical protein PKD53_20660 [Chloroflexaceae bacterium]|nr:hypothetical protein [Chloroflexaceae bacterium]
MDTRLAIVERLLDVLHTGGRGPMWEILSTELKAILDLVEIEQRYMVGLHWLDAVHQQLAEAGAILPALSFLRVLIRAGGDELDQTVFLPTGLQQIALN